MEHSQADMEHIYYEVPGDISAKPKALCDLIEAAARPKTIIYCNNPSDTDLVEVFLRRRGIPCEKLIGNVPPRRLQEVMKEVNAREVCALVVTDIAANNLPIEDFELSISHSSPSDPEIYLHRIGDSNTATNLKRSLSLVAPSDLTNFQYLKKIVSYDFNKGDLPSEQELMKSKMTAFITEATATDASAEVLEAAKEILAHESSNQLVAFLLDKFMAEKQDEKSNRRERGNRHQNDSRHERSTEDYRADSDEDYDSRPTRKTAVEMKKDARFYVGLGSAQNYSEDSIVEALRAAGVPEEIAIERVCVRANYSIIDVGEESSEAVSSAISGKSLESGTPLHAYLATTISSPKKVENVEQENSEDGEEDSSVSEGEEAQASAL